MSEDEKKGKVLHFKNKRPEPPADRPWMGDLKLTKTNETLSNPYNAYVVLKNDEGTHGYIKWNQVMLRVEVTGGILTQCPNPEKLDNIVTKAQDFLAASYDINLGRDEVGRRISYIAEENQYDPLKEYLDDLVWDGDRRLDRWLIDYAGADDNEYSVFVGRKWMLSCVARAYQPGCKADVVLVAEGDQGAHKSTLFRILGGPWYCEAAGILGDKDSKQLIGAAWICELPDMASFSKTGRNMMKAFFTSAEDRYRPPYAKDTISVKRRAVFAATTNDEKYLGDPTGNRRFHPVLLKEIDRAALIRDRDQLWAEAVAIYKATFNCEDCNALEEVVPGERNRCEMHCWWLTKEELAVAKGEVKARQESDVWKEKVLAFAKKPVDMSGKPVALTTANILIYALDMEIKEGDQSKGMRVSDIMRHAGYYRDRRGTDEDWLRPDQDEKTKNPDIQEVKTSENDSCGLKTGALSPSDMEIMEKLGETRPRKR